jgi:hypothetical protein
MKLKLTKQNWDIWLWVVAQILSILALVLLFTIPLAGLLGVGLISIAVIVSLIVMIFRLKMREGRNIRIGILIFHLILILLNKSIEGIASLFGI